MLQPGQRLFDGRYRLVRHLRAGGAGVVWEGEDQRPRRGDAAAVAIKVIDASGGGAEAAAREAEVATRVRHPNVVTVRHAFVEDGLAFLVMDLGWGSLFDLVSRQGPLAPPLGVGCVLQAAQALAAAHRVGVVHRDVKPHNLLLFPDGTVRLADFGIARAMVDATARTRTGALLGTITFMAPEQRRDPRAVQPATDVYALAVTLAWLLLGDTTEEPWTEEAAAQLRSAGVPDGLIARIAQAGARRPEDRPAHGAALVDLLQASGVVADLGGLRQAAAKPLGADTMVVAPAAPPPVVQRSIGGWVLGLGVALAAGLGLGRLFGPAAEATPAAPPLPPCATTITDWSEDVRAGPEETVAGALADIDKDGLLDAIFSNQGAETATIWWGERGQMPTQHQEVPLGRTGAPVAVADVDQDGFPDLIGALQDYSAIAEMRGAGERSFHPPTRVFQNPPPTSLAVLTPPGSPATLVFSELRGNLNTRTRAAAWGPHRMLMNEVDGVTVAGLVPSGGSVYVMMTGEQGARARSHQRGPLETPPLQRWIASPSSQQDDYRLFGVTADREIVQISPEAPPCVLGREFRHWQYAAIGDLDGDGVLDAIAHATCRLCTSNQVFIRGIGGP